jgi:hypothetical protein
MLIFNFIFDLMWRGRDSSVTSVGFLGFSELEEIEKHEAKGLCQIFHAYSVA